MTTRDGSLGIGSLRTGQSHPPAPAHTPPPFPPVQWPGAEPALEYPPDGVPVTDVLPTVPPPDVPDRGAPGKLYAD